MSNNQAIIATIDAVEPIAKADKIHVAVVLGERVVVSKEYGVGKVGVFFHAGIQLSEKFCRHNNLNRDSSLNENKEVKGFFEKSRRVRSQPFLGVHSDAFFVGVESLDAFSPTHEEKVGLTKVGFSFDHLGGEEVCRKYVSTATLEAIERQKKQGVKKVKLVEFPDFDKHVDSDHFMRGLTRIRKGDLINIQSKRHGTSFRVGKMKKKTEEGFFSKIISKLTGRKPKDEFEFVVGTRNVVLSTPEKNGFHGPEKYRFEILEEMKHALRDGMIVYGEIVGFVNGRPIMADHNIKALKEAAALEKFGEKVTYSYGCAQHEYRWFVYRVVYVTESGLHIDLSQSQLEEWCKNHGFGHTLNLCEPFVFDGVYDTLVEKVKTLSDREEELGADPTDPRHLHEGTIIRVDNGSPTPLFFKNKTYRFRVCEGHCEAFDVEDAS